MEVKVARCGPTRRQLRERYLDTARSRSRGSPHRWRREAQNEGRRWRHYQRGNCHQCHQGNLGCSQWSYTECLPTERLGRCGVGSRKITQEWMLDGWWKRKLGEGRRGPPWLCTWIAVRRWRDCGWESDVTRTRDMTGIGKAVCWVWNTCGLWSRRPTGCLDERLDDVAPTCEEPVPHARSLPPQMDHKVAYYDQFLDGSSESC